MADKKTEQEKADKVIEKAQKTGLEAKVKDNYMFGNITAFSGLEYTKGEWRKVPVGMEDQALVHPFLDVREAGTEKEIKISSKEVIANAQATSDKIIAQMMEPETPAAPVQEVSNREVEPVGDPKDPTVKEAKEEALEDEETTSKKKSSRKK
jgi:hypothetical protein